MSLIDTHCHIYASDFNADRQAMLSRAAHEGITKMLMPAIDMSTHVQMLRLENEFPGKCLSMMGLHPCSVKENYRDEMGAAEKYFEKRSFAAVGETGLDFYWDLTYTKQQYEVFDECIELVAKNQNGKLKGVFHCFSGSIEQAIKITDLNFYLGIGGVLTFKKSGLDNVVGELGLDHIVLETDAPYLAPVPFRGKRNECSYLKYVAEKLAEIKKVSVEEIAEITTANAKELFDLSSYS
jgi:TatD DNase family protein